MKEKLLNILIIFLGAIALFAFYAYWSAGKESNIDTRPITHTLDTEDSSIDYSKDTIQPTISLQKQNKIFKELIQKQESESIKKIEDIPSLSVDEKEEETEMIYQSLKPSGYEEVVEKANEAFEELDERVIEVDNEIKKHLNGMLDNMEKGEIDVEESEEDYIMELPNE